MPGNRPTRRRTEAPTSAARRRARKGGVGDYCLRTVRLEGEPFGKAKRALHR
jgi:hypothetical protein